MNRSVFEDNVGRLAATFNRNLPLSSRDEWYEALKGFPDNTIVKAVDRLKEKAERMPSLAQVVSECYLVGGRKAGAIQPDCPRCHGSGYLQPQLWLGNTYRHMIYIASPRCPCHPEYRYDSHGNPQPAIRGKDGCDTCGGAGYIVRKLAHGEEGYDWPTSATLQLDGFDTGGLLDVQELCRCGRSA